MPDNVNQALAADTDMKMWTWVRQRAARDKDLSAALDIMKYFVIHGTLLPLHIDAANELMAGKSVDNVGSLTHDEVPEPVKVDRHDPAVVLKRLFSAGMLRGKNGTKAHELLNKAND